MSSCTVSHGTISIPYLLSCTSFKFHTQLPHSSSVSLRSLAPLSPQAKTQLIYCGRSNFRPHNINRCKTSNSAEPIIEDISEFIVVNFYHLVFIEDPHLEVSTHSSFLDCQGLDIHGRIYFNGQGINAQFSGPSKDALAYVDWVREDHRFTNILVQLSPSTGGHAFPRLKLRYKPSLVQFDLGVQDLPLLEPSMRATPISPAEWRKKLYLVNSNGDTTNGDQNKSCILLDVRNGYEWDIGHFHGAQRPEVACFRTTSFGLSDAEVIDSDPLVNVDKDKTDILMYCTGGIRCDVYSTILRQKGFKNLYTLKGGISNYLQQEGPHKWIGNLFVFDSRLSLPPSTFKPGASSSTGSQEASDDSKFATCYICGSQVHELRHRNCVNLDCNLLFLCCRNCVEELGGCCRPECKTAPRMRPILLGNERYEKWHIYRDGKLEQRALSCNNNQH